MILRLERFCERVHRRVWFELSIVSRRIVLVRFRGSIYLTFLVEETAALLEETRGLVLLFMPELRTR